MHEIEPKAGIDTRFIISSRSKLLKKFYKPQGLERSSQLRSFGLKFPSASLLPLATLGPPDFKADIVFMVDTSTEVSPQNYRTEKHFVKLIARHLNVFPGKSRAAFIVYSSNPAVVSRLDGFTTTSNFMSAVDRASYLGGERRIDRALSSAATLLESARPSVRKVTILLTSGNQLREQEVRTLEGSVRSLRNLGVSTYAIAVGAELKPLVYKPEDVFTAGSYDLLPLQVEPMARHITTDEGL